jgi:hypothetical protein
LPTKNRVKLREINARYYLKHKKVCKDRIYSVRRLLEDEVRVLKESSPCVDCGRSYPYYVMQYDHLGDKIDGVAVLVHSRHSRKVVFEEIAKCELVCANCHAIRTHARNFAAEAERVQAPA